MGSILKVIGKQLAIFVISILCFNSNTWATCSGDLDQQAPRPYISSANDLERYGAQEFMNQLSKNLEGKIGKLELIGHDTQNQEFLIAEATGKLGNFSCAYADTISVELIVKTNGLDSFKIHRPEFSGHGVYVSSLGVIFELSTDPNRQTHFLRFTEL